MVGELCLSYVYQAEGEKRISQKVTTRTYRNIISQLADLGCKEINLQGSGEPLLSNNIDDILDMLLKMV